MRLRTVAVALFLLASSLRAGFAQNLYSLEVQESEFKYKGLWSDDVRVLQQIIPRWSSEIGPDSLGVAQYQAHLGTALHHTGDYPAAERAFRSSIAILEAAGTLYGEAVIIVKRRLFKSLKEQNKSSEADALAASLPPISAKPKNDTEPKVLVKRDPEYTDAARAKSISGFIEIEATIDETGRVSDTHILEPLGFGLDESALKAVSKWRFKPATRNGQPVPASVSAEVGFHRF